MTSANSDNKKAAQTRGERVLMCRIVDVELTSKIKTNVEHNPKYANAPAPFHRERIQQGEEQSWLVLNTCALNGAFDNLRLERAPVDDLVL